jgi:hypothetical protein
LATEKAWLAVPASDFTADGTQFGVVTIADTTGYKVKGYAFIAATGQNVQQLQIQRVISSTQLILGRLGTSPQPNQYVDLRAYTVASNATIGFPEQPKNKIKPDDIEQATYEADPTVAVRVIPVDPYGGLVGPDNPLAVTFDGTISIGQVEIKGSPSGDLLNVNADGSLNVNLEGLTAFQTSQYTVGLTPVQITPTPMPNRSSVGFKAVIVTTTDAIYIGNSSGVTTSTGYPLFSRDTLEMDLDAGETIYAVSTVAGATLCVVELGD